MAKMYNFLILGLGFCFLQTSKIDSNFGFQKAISAKEITWQMLSDVVFEEKYIDEMEDYYFYPKFSKSVLSLENQFISITGYVIPVDIEAGLYVLSSNPYSSCFFCGGGGPETVMELNFKNQNRRFKTDERLAFKGKLKLNSEDYYRLNYILEEAELF